MSTFLATIQGNVPPHEDNFLKITGEARLIGLGTQTVKSLYARSNRELPPEFVDGEKNGKVDVCAEKVFERWEQSHNVKGVQLVFSDIAVNDDNGNFSAYKYIRDELIAKGVPPEQIIFAPKSDAKDREDIFKKINSGEYRIVIASTETLGTGCNIQQKLVALHHLDIPWKPSSLEQREGRILRQGNENSEVEILNYVTESTLDSYLYSTVTNKARFIAQILDNESPARVCEDLDVLYCKGRFRETPNTITAIALFATHLGICERNNPQEGIVYGIRNWELREEVA